MFRFQRYSACKACVLPFLSLSGKSTLSLHSPQISWSQTWQEGGAHFWWLLLCKSGGCSLIGSSTSPPAGSLSFLVLSSSPSDIDIANELSGPIPKSNIVPCSFSLVGFRSLVKVESTYWVLVNLFNMQNELMDVYQSDISKMLFSSTSNLVSFMLFKSCHLTWAYHVLLHKTSHTSCVLFFFWFPHASSRESTPPVSSR